MKNVLLLLVFLPLHVLATGENFPIGARSAGMGHASVTLSDLWSVHHNQAGLAQLEAVEAGFFYESRFTLNELSLRGGAIAVPTKSGTFGLSASSFGFTAYNESKYGLAYGRQLGEKLSFGLQLNYHSIRIAENYGNRNAVSVEAGVLAKLNSKLTVGAHLYNPNRAKISDFDNERIPTILRLGMNYRFSDKVIIAVETEKDVDHTAVLRVGIEYRLNDFLYLRGGIGTNPTLSSFGFGLNLKQFKLDLSNSFHQVLGHTPQLSLTYQF